ncbi:MAG: tRNA(Ile)-lysidine synthase [Chlamydiales bacterium]|nr:tRNA(Ile)-lysidine synthase [Chlamydiales bacterium]
MIFRCIVLEEVLTFIDCQNLKKEPLLLGLSGGPDSMALFHLLRKINHPFQAAHLDHGWRPESREEGNLLVQMCQKYGVRCHLRSVKIEGKNLEDASRQARYHFFEELVAQERLAGVVLGHHADDQAETVLKRVFEGASLPKLKGLTPRSQLGALTLYRPLLRVQKKQVIAWLENEKISYFSDPTNQETRFLRGRMRVSLLPFLSAQFGKQIQPSLCRLGEAAHELAEFLDCVTAPFKAKIVENQEAVTLDFHAFPSQPRLIYKALIRDLFGNQRLALPQSVLETILLHIQKNSARKTIQVGQTKVEMDRGVLMIKKLKL